METMDYQKGKAGANGSRPPKEADLKVAGRECMAALLVMLAEDGGLMTETEAKLRKGGEPFTYGRDFTVATTYPRGVYLIVTVSDDMRVQMRLNKYRGLFDSYAFSSFEQDGKEYFRYEFRLADDIGNFETYKEL